MQIESNNMVSLLAIKVIELLQGHIQARGYTPVVHFEIEGCYQCHAGLTLNYDRINTELASAGIIGKLVPEYWQGQWEFVSDFNGQTPLQEAQSAARALKLIPALIKKQGIDDVMISPVVWGGDSRRMAKGSRQIFHEEKRAVHIPNAVQLNVSIKNENGDNLIANKKIGELLQHCFLTTSKNCALLYLPEPAAYERILLKTKYGLDDELCSPSNISGGHQGSVALYLEKGKHNQIMGEHPLVIDRYQQIIRSESKWQQTARVEHRLGASSELYNPHINMVYALLNVIDALNMMKHEAFEINDFKTQQLPEQLTRAGPELGAMELLIKDTWFAQSIDHIWLASNEEKANTEEGLGKRLKQAFLAQYQQKRIIC